MANKWVDETVRCFITDAADIEPTNPVKAIERHFERNATEELKAKCSEEKKTAATCWRFIEAVALAALHGKSGHIDPGVVYAIAMHYFQDVPKDWNDAKTEAEEKQVKTAAESGQTESNGYRSNDPEDVAAAKRSMELAEKRRYKMTRMGRPEKPKKQTKAKARPKSCASQGFFFDVLEDIGNHGEGREKDCDAE